MDGKAHVINQILITGDFFAYPKRRFSTSKAFLRIQRPLLPISKRSFIPFSPLKSRRFLESAKLISSRPLRRLFKRQTFSPKGSVKKRLTTSSLCEALYGSEKA